MRQALGITLLAVMLLVSGAASHDDPDDHWPTPLELRRDLQAVGYSFELVTDSDFISWWRVGATPVDSWPPVGPPVWVGGDGEPSEIARDEFLAIPALGDDVLPLVAQLEYVSLAGYGPAMTALGELVERLPLEWIDRVAVFDILAELDWDTAAPSCLYRELGDITVIAIAGDELSYPLVVMAADPATAFPAVWDGDDGWLEFDSCRHAEDRRD